MPEPEIPRSVHLVQTIQREFRRGAKTDRAIAKSVNQPMADYSHRDMCAALEVNTPSYASALVSRDVIVNSISSL